MGHRPRTPGPSDLEARLKGRRLVEPPRDTLHRALALSAQLPHGAPGILAWVIEQLFDSAATPVPVGIRGAVSQERRLLYRLRPADDRHPGGSQLDLLLKREASGSLTLQGQMLPAVTGAQIEVRSGRSRRAALPGDAGDFILRDVPARAAGITLAIQLPGSAPIVISDLTLPPASA